MTWSRLIIQFLVLCVVMGCAKSNIAHTKMTTQGIDTSVHTPVRVITNVSVFTGYEYLPHTNLVFDSSGILDISAEIEKYTSITEIDGTGKTVVPPMINAHVHLWFPVGSKESLQEGIYANLDMHNTDAGADFLRAFNDSLDYALYYAANAAATVPGGHGTQFGIPVPTINDTVSPSKFVADRIAAGADYIKLIREPLMVPMSVEHSKEVIDATHEHGKLVVGHSQNVNDSNILIGQGVDGLMHLWMDKKSDDIFLTSLAESGSFVVPTMLVIKKLLEMGAEADWIEYVLSWDEVKQELKKVYDLGVPILCGTDAPNFGINYGGDYFSEMLLLGEAGMSNIDVLKAATTNVYKAFQLDSFTELGPGSNADFILVDGNPVVDLTDIRSPKQIFRKGQQVYQTASSNN